MENVWARLTELPSIPPRMGLFAGLAEWLKRGIDPRPRMYDMAPTWRAFQAGLLQPGNPIQYPKADRVGSRRWPGPRRPDHRGARG